MKAYLLITCFFISPFFYAQATETQKSSTATDAIAVYDFKSLEPLLYTETDKVYIVNFWAMWCAPCVKELPIIAEYKKNNPTVELLLVSLDFPENIEKSLKPFLKKKGITAKVVILDDPDANGWIDKINPNWSGSLPFTILFNSKNRSYHERAFVDSKDLENEINKIINQ
ncbi:TlpA family protein disulfide reductase [Flavobacterium muglaense]|uniref:TlpA family protein disulfide reductase n=1 Tax=Flavobacterium muglaense TaxID=2764716 RepID=A0A923N453_9FLAO|nr:TlpA disulfide reductase family protein [Flavobacterium muglaense]MBC5838813.1 TlpA family protein disulfide reductase [Flavobacterium muglaense]MBC5845303.1 TlpA family protein disulfide reductase [Flavobacterium muglaense]